MNIAKLTTGIEKFAIDNSPLIMTAVGVVGTITTAYLTHKATFTSTLEMTERNSVMKMKGEPALTRKEIVKLTWTNYLPPVASGTITVGAIVCANRISARRMAALAAGYSLLDNRFDDYKAKVKEKLGVNKEQAARDEIAQDRVNENPPDKTVIITSGKSLFKDEPSGRYFESDMETVKRAQNDTNYQILSKEYAVLTDFYERIGLAPTSLSEEFGWDLTQDRMEITFSTVITQDGKPCICMDYNIHPVRNGYSSGGSQKIHAV